MKKYYYLLAFLGLYFSSSAHASLPLDYNEVMRIFKSAKVESFPYTFISKYNNPSFQTRADLYVAEYQAPDNTKWVFASHYGLDRVLDGGKREVGGGQELMEVQMRFSELALASHDGLPQLIKDRRHFSDLDPKFDAPHYFYWMHFEPNYVPPVHLSFEHLQLFGYFEFYLFKKKKRSRIADYYT